MRLSRYAPSRRRLLATLAHLPLIAWLMTAERLRPARSASQLGARAKRTIAAVIDRLLPGGDLPSGLALHIDRAVIETADAETLGTFALGVAWLDRRARRRGAGDFLALDAAGREAVLRAAQEAADEEGAAAVAQTLRRRAFMLYYTHTSVMAAFAYTGPPQPDGFPDFQEAPR